MAAPTRAPFPDLIFPPDPEEAPALLEQLRALREMAAIRERQSPDPLDGWIGGGDFDSYRAVPGAMVPRSLHSEKEGTEETETTEKAASPCDVGRGALEAPRPFSVGVRR